MSLLGAYSSSESEDESEPMDTSNTELPKGSRFVKYFVFKFETLKIWPFFDFLSLEKSPRFTLISNPEKCL